MNIAYRPDLFSTLLADELKRRGWNVIEENDPGRLITSGSADIALGPALGYARHLGLVEYGLIPEFGLTLRGFSGLLRLAFRPGNAELTRIAVRSSGDFESLAAGLIMIEKHDIEPEFVEVGPDADLQVMLDSGDGAVLGGAEALASAIASLGGLDIGDEWEDLTEHPFPYLLAWGNSAKVTEANVIEFLAARDQVVLSLPDLAARSERPEILEALHRAYLGGETSFTLQREEAAEVLNPLYHYLFYHGLITDLPSIKFVPPPESGTEESEDVDLGTLH